MLGLTAALAILFISPVQADDIFDCTPRVEPINTGWLSTEVVSFDAGTGKAIVNDAFIT